MGGFLGQMGGMLQQYLGGNAANEEQAVQHYEQVATQAPQSAVAGGLASVFRSPETGTFGQNIGSLFGASNPQQRAGILNQLLPSLSGMGGLGSILGGLGGGSQSVPSLITPEQAQQISPQQAEQMANHAQQQNPSIVDQASQFYSQHPTLVKALGAGAAIMVLRHIAEATQR